jgi:uncharacterized membrane protein
MIEFVIWLVTLLAIAFIANRSPHPFMKAVGIIYLLVGLGAGLGLYLTIDTLATAYILDSLNSIFVLEVFIFLNIVTGYAFYESRNYRKHT